MHRTLSTVAVLAACVAVGGCSSWMKALEDWRARDGGSRPYASLEGTKWEWQSGTLPGGVVMVPDPRRYTVEFLAEHRVLVRADCNRGQGAWTARLATISMGPMGFTKRACAAGSLSKEFAQSLESVQTWFLREGYLFLELPRDRGTLRLALADAPLVR